MKLTIETEKGNFNIQEDQFIIRSGLQNFHKEGYYFNYCILILYTKSFRSKISDLEQINKIIYDDGYETAEFENAKLIGCLGHSGVFGESEELKKSELSSLLDNNNFNKILESYFKERYEKIYKSIKGILMDEIDLNYQIGLNVYLSLKA